MEPVSAMQAWAFLVMKIPDYDIAIQPIEIEFPDGWDNALTRYMSDENYTIEQLIEDDYQEHKKEYARMLMKSILRR